jgi:hypothetical protein
MTEQEKEKRENFVTSIKSAWSAFLTVGKAVEILEYHCHHLLSAYMETLGWEEVEITMVDEAYIEEKTNTQMWFKNPSLPSNMVICLNGETEITKITHCSEKTIVCTKVDYQGQWGIDVVLPDSTETIVIPYNVFCCLFKGQQDDVSYHFEDYSSELIIYYGEENEMLLPYSQWIFMLDYRSEFLHELKMQTVHKYPTKF